MAKIVEIEQWELISTELLPDGWMSEDYEQVGYKTDLRLYRQHVRYFYWQVGGLWHFSHAETLSEEAIELPWARS